MARRKRGNPVHGWVNFDKPLGMTSTQAVGKVRWLYDAQKAGHAGTLDPQASGILPIALGDATKTVPFLVEARKIYIFGVKWGERTDTLDVEGEIVATSDHLPSKADIEAALPAFIGEIQQAPPAYSAIKIDGKRAYDLARAGEAPEMKARAVEIDEIELLESDENTALLRIKCGKGTYIRSLARDLAHALGTEGYVISLRREAVGPFKTDTAFSLDALEELVHKGGVLAALLAVETALDDIPVLAITAEERADLKQGRAIVLLPSTQAALEAAFRPRMIGELDASRYVLAKCEDKAVALCDTRHGQLGPKRVFNM
jgi:tRNA pseudouridine55 synthase